MTRPPQTSILCLGHEQNLAQPIEMSVTGEKIGTVREGGRIDDRVRRRQFVLRAEISGRERDRRVEIGDDAGLGEGDHLIRLILACLAGEPFRQLELDDDGDLPLRFSSTGI